jgi:signal recognition particle subunit SRP54
VGEQGKEKESAARIKKFMTIMDSMTNKELDCPNPKVLQEPSRIMRLARGSGCHPYHVQELIGDLTPPPSLCSLCCSLACEGT